MVAIKQKLARLSDGTMDEQAWLEKIKNDFHLDDISLIQKAALFANESYKGLTTFYGQPCIEQSLEMAEIILDLKLDAEAVAASIMANATQYTQITIDKIHDLLGENVAKLVKGSHDMEVVHTLLPNIHKSRDPAKIDRLRKTFLAMVSDIRVVLIKLAEQMCVMRGIKNINPLERERIAQETFDIYAPLANRLGIGQLKWELEDLAFHYMNPETYKMIANYLAERRIDREKRIHDVIERLNEQFKKNSIKADISGRAKHIYSIYLKMQKKHLDYKDIYDASAVRILVPTLDDCYNALGIVHHLWEHIPEEFDNYIANPKPNGYRSIHTAVIGPEGKNLEIQIRTGTMHDEAEHGIAAHWLYKEKKLPASGYEARISFLRELLSWHTKLHKKESHPANNMEDVFEDRVYVFTPVGDIVDLMKGATPLDFAYHIHTDLGHRCRGAKINGHIVPLTYPLVTGDRVDIITTLKGAPSRDWLNKELRYLKTSRARAKVSQWFKQQETDQYVQAGKEILEKELIKSGLTHIDFTKMALRFNFKNADALLSTLGHGSIRAAQIIQAAKEAERKQATNTQTIITTHTKKSTANVSGLQIDGTNDLLTRIAKCCKPIPFDPIVGYITQGRGVSVHRNDCNNIRELSPDHANRVIEVNWENQQHGNYDVDLQIRAQGKEQLLKDITGILTQTKINLIMIKSAINKSNNALFITMTVQIHHTEQLRQLFAEINKLPNVNDIKRI